MYIDIPKNANSEDAICNLDIAISLFRLLITSYFEEIEEPIAYGLDREHIGNLIRAAEDYVRGAKEILEAELKRATADRKEPPQHTTE